MEIKSSQGLCEHKVQVFENVTQSSTQLQVFKKQSCAITTSLSEISESTEVSEKSTKESPSSSGPNHKAWSHCLVRLHFRKMNPPLI